jgi:anti-anti-sigma factor
VETFRIRAVPGDGICTLVLSGEADMAVADDIVELGTVSLREPAVETLILDLAAMTFMDSTAIAAMVRLRNLAGDQGKKMTLSHVSAKLTRLLQITALTDVFTIAD